ncbi:MAG TPA: AAA family ATPase [Polyangia bacterium]
MDRASLVIIGAGSETETRLREVLQNVIDISAVEPDLARAAARHRDPAPGLCLVVLEDGAADAGLRLTRALSGSGSKVIVAGRDKDPELILGALRAGAREYVVLGAEQELKRAIRALLEAAPAGGSITTIFPAKGGVGATTLATNLAGALARRGGRVCLLDLGLYLGDVLSFLDLPGGYSIADAIANMRRFDRELLDSSVARHSGGFAVLAQSDQLEEAEAVKAPDVTTLLGFLRRHYDHVVVDGVRNFDELCLAALDQSDHVLMTLTQDVPAVRNAQRSLALFRRLGYDQRKLHVVINRFAKNATITPEVITETLGQPIAAMVGNDFPALINAINRGLLLFDAAPRRSRVAQDLEALAAIVTEAAPAAAIEPGFLKGLFTRRAADGAR